MPARFPRGAVALAAGLAITVAAAGFSAPAAAHQAKPKITSIAAPAPHGAAADPDLQLTDIACPAAGNCWAVGTYRAGNGAHRGVLEHLTGGTWHAQTAPSPIFADSDPKMTLIVITCASIHFCVAFGTYTDATDAPQKQGLLETYERETPDADPTWHGSRLFATPGGTRVAQITAASCSSDRTCAAVGSYLSVHGVRHAQLETYGPGGWTATDAPSDGAAAGDRSLAAVDCPGDGLCSAAGYYVAANGAQVGLLERLDSSAWTQEAGAAPAGAKSHPDLRLRTIDCPGIDACLAGGRYTTHSGQERGVFETRALGSWSPTVAPVPAASAADPGMVLTAVSCADVGTCAATSERTDAHGRPAGALLRLSSGHWHAVSPALPHAAANPHVQLTDLACSQVVVGSYTAADGHTRPALETLGADGSWTGRRGPLPTRAGVGTASLAAVACDPGGRAIAVGRYVDGSGRHRGMITQNVPA